MEGFENEEIITITLSNGLLKDQINSEAITLSNLPLGVTKGTVTKVSSTEAYITLVGNRTRDYDSNLTGVTVTIESNQFKGYFGPPINANSGVTFTASNPELTIMEPKNQAPFNHPLTNEKIVAFKVQSPVDSTLDFEVSRVGGPVTSFSNTKVYIDLNDDGIVDATEQVTSDGAGETIDNGGVLGIQYNGESSALAKVIISGLNLNTSQMSHDIMIIGDMTQLVQIGIGKNYAFKATNLNDEFENIIVSGTIVK